MINLSKIILNIIVFALGCASREELGYVIDAVD
jgi:hypothetical protein